MFPDVSVSVHFDRHVVLIMLLARRAGSPSVLRIQANSAVLGTRQPSPTGPSTATRPSTSNAVLSFPSSTWPRSKNNTLTLSRPVAAKPKVRWMHFPEGRGDAGNTLAEA